jgi:DNA polymerase-3 subunit beta
MKIKISKQELLKGLNKLTGITAGKAVQPILNNVLIETLPENVIKLTGYNFSIMIETLIKAEEITTHGIYTLPCHQLTSITNSFNKEINIDVNYDEGIALITEGKSKLKIKGIPAEQYPPIDDLINTECIELPTNIILEGLNKALTCVQCDNTGQESTGVFTALGNNSIEFCGLDGFRMSVYSGSIESNKEMSVIIPHTTVSEILKNIENCGKVKLYIQNNFIKFDFGNDVIYSSLVEGSFPKYKPCIPTEFKHNIKINKDDISSVIKKIEAIADKDISDIDVNFGNNETVINYKSKEGCELSESIECQHEGELPVKLNYKYLLKGLKSLDIKDVEIKGNEYNSAIVIEENNYLFLIMPVVK